MAYRSEGRLLPVPIIFVNRGVITAGKLTAQQVRLTETATGELERFDSMYLNQREYYLALIQLALQRDPGWQQRVREMANSGSVLSAI